MKGMAKKQTAKKGILRGNAVATATPLPRISAILSDRRKRLLFALIEEYVKNKIPVSSNLLAKRGYFNLSSATLRSEMQELEDLGLLEQPHTSAGRIPSDAGYRLFVNEFFNGSGLAADKTCLPASPAGGQAGRRSPVLAENTKTPADIVKSLAKQAKGLAIFHDAVLHDFFQSGFPEFFANPEFEDSRNIVNFGKFFEKLENEFDELFAEIENDSPRIFIGRELPMKEAENFSLIVSRCDFGGERSGIFALLGPKRMDYRRNWRLLNDLIRLLK